MVVQAAILLSAAFRAARAVHWAERAAADAAADLAYEEAARLYERALQAGSPGLGGKDRCRLSLSRAQALYRSGAVDSAIAAAEEAADEARRCGDPVAMAHAALTLGGVADESWERRVIQLCEAALPQLGDDHTELRARLLAAVATVRSYSLRPDDSDQAGPLSQQAISLAEAASTPGAKLASLTGDPRHEHWFATLDRQAGQRPLVARRVILLVHLAGRGELDRATAMYEQLPPWAEWQVPRFAAHAAIDQRARAAALLGDQSGAAVAYERLRPWARYFVVGGTGMVAMHGSGELTLGCLAACLGKPGAAVRHLRSAVAANQRACLPPFEHEARYELAKLLTRRGRPQDRAEALVLATDAARAAADMGMGPLRADAEGLAGRLRDGAGRSGPPGLTHRERQIAALVARGLTNRQIADLLHVAERTAENHVHHILTKLGCQNRTQIAAWAVTQRPGDPQL